MRYRVSYSEKAKKALKKLDKTVQTLIITWVEKNLVDTTNPKQHGKALTGNYSGYWRYRVGNYRIIAEIQDDKLIIFIIKIGHRSKIY